MEISTVNPGEITRPSINSQTTAASASATPVIQYSTIVANVSTFAVGFMNPTGIAFDTIGILFVVNNDRDNILKVDKFGAVTLLATTGTNLSRPTSMAFGKFGNFYVADSRNHRIALINATGFVSSYAGGGASTFRDGQGTFARFSDPRRIVIDSNDNFFVTDFQNNCVRRIISSGYVTKFSGNTSIGFNDGQGANALFDNPS